MSRSTKYRDSLLFSLTLYDVNTGKNRLQYDKVFFLESSDSSDLVNFMPLSRAFVNLYSDFMPNVLVNNFTIYSEERRYLELP